MFSSNVFDGWAEAAFIDEACTFWIRSAMFSCCSGFKGSSSGDLNVFWRISWESSVESNFFNSFVQSRIVFWMLSASCMNFEIIFLSFLFSFMTASHSLDLLGGFSFFCDGWIDAVEMIRKSEAVDASFKSDTGRRATIFFRVFDNKPWNVFSSS